MCAVFPPHLAPIQPHRRKSHPAIANCNYSPVADNLEVVLDALVVDELARLEVAHGDLGLANGAADGRVRASATEDRVRGEARGDHDG